MSKRIARMSLAALRMAASASLTDPALLAQWLYRYGTVPRGPAIDRDFGPEDDPMFVLGLTMGGRARRLLDAAYEPASFQGWYSFVHSPARAQIAPACKLYVSPGAEMLADAFPRIVEVFVRAEVRSFKIGRGIEGLLRPDKILAYFEERQHMDVVARALASALDGCRAQGVPFTAPLSDDGMLSWGIDPPPGDAAASWRAWITKRIAERLAAARDAAPDPVAATLEALRTDDVDPECWLAGPNAFVATSVQ